VTLRVLHCIYDHPANPWVAGGGAVRVHELYSRLAGRVDATVVTGNFPGARGGAHEGVEYVQLGRRTPYAWSRLSYAASANRLLRSADYDVAVFDFSSYTPIFIPRGRPVGITVHHLTGPTAAGRWGRVPALPLGAVERAMLRRAKHFSATSHATRDALREIVGPGASIDLVQAGVPDDLFELSREPADFILYFGRLDVFHKGLDTLLKAYARLSRDRALPPLRLAGRGKDAERVREIARRLGIAGQVELLGAVTESTRRDLFSGALIQVMPSRFEGFGMVAAEAMAAGIPLIAARSGSLPEVLDAPEGGVLVPPDDAAALAEAMAALLDDPARRVELSRSARLSAERFRWDSVADRHLRFLQHVSGREASDPLQSR
jgi:glycogen synthase